MSTGRGHLGSAPLQASVWVVVAVMCMAACGDDGSPVQFDAGSDSGTPADGGGEDAGGPSDAGPSPDGSGFDSGIPDGSVRDGGLPDGAASDAGSVDGSAADAGRVDAGSGDAGARDAGSPDAGALDAGSMDAGVPDGGSGRAPGAGELVIVEIQGNPNGVLDDDAEYIELINISGDVLDLMGVTLAYVDWTGGEPVRSRTEWVVDEPVLVGPAGRLLLARGESLGDGSHVHHVYGTILFTNGTASVSRIRLYVPSWSGAEPPSAADLIDEVQVPAHVFGNDVRGRSWQLDPALVPSPTASTNDAPSSWCISPTDGPSYRTDNWGTPGAMNDCL